MRPRHRVIVAIATLSLVTLGSVSCGPVACREDAGPATVTLNQTAVETPAVVLDAPFHVYSGAQGGNHFWMQMRVRGVCTSNAYVTVTLESGEAVIAEGRSVPGMWQEAEGDPGTWRTNPIQVFVNNRLALCNAAQTHTEVRVVAVLNGPNLWQAAELRGPVEWASNNCPAPDVTVVDASGDAFAPDVVDDVTASDATSADAALDAFDASAAE